MTVYKGYGLPKEAEEYLLSRGLKNAICSIGAADVQADLFGQLVPCPFQVGYLNNLNSIFVSLLKMSYKQ